MPVSPVGRSVLELLMNRLWLAIIGAEIVKFIAGHKHVEVELLFTEEADAADESLDLWSLFRLFSLVIAAFMYGTMAA